MGGEVLIAVAFFAVVFGIFFLRTRENMSLIDKGINPRKNYGGPKPYAYMKYALLLVGAGLGLLIAYLVDISYLRELTATRRPDGTMHHSENPAIYFALLAIGGGWGLFTAYKLEKKDMKERQKTEEETTQSL